MVVQDALEVAAARQREEASRRRTGERGLTVTSDISAPAAVAEHGSDTTVYLRAEMAVFALERCNAYKIYC